jgi:hypothetical protein
MRKLALFALACLIAGAAAAQAPNDANVVPNPAPLPPPAPQGGPPPGCETCPPTGTQPQQFTGNNSETERLFRDGVPSTCANKPYPGPFAASVFWDSFTYHNFGPAACITVSWNVDTGANPCGTNAHAKVYAPTYDNNNQSVNFLGDVGSSITQPFQVTVPADSDFVLVAENTASPATCTYAFEIQNVPCQTDPSLCQIPVELQSFELDAQ